MLDGRRLREVLRIALGESASSRPDLKSSSHLLDRSWLRNEDSCLADCSKIRFRWIARCDRAPCAALIAYAGTAHVVMPATTDGGIINTFAQPLDPKIMPFDGDVAADAMLLANQTLAESGSGSIVWITDSIAPEPAEQLEQWRKKSGTPVRLLAPLLSGSELDGLSKTARHADARLVRLTADNGDVVELARAAKFSSAATGQLSDRWQEAGYFLMPLIAVLLLPRNPAPIPRASVCAVSRWQLRGGSENIRPRSGRGGCF